MDPVHPDSKPGTAVATDGRPVVVLVHGYLGGSQQWAQEVDQLAKRYRVITPDLPGFASAADQPAPESIEGFATQVIATIDDAGVDRFILLGHSMGGMIAQEIARRVGARVTRLVLYGTGPLGRMPDRFESLDVSIARLQADGVVETARRITATWLVRGEDDPAYPLLCRIGAEASAEAALAALSAMARWDGRDALGTLTMPTLILWGDRDRSYLWPQVQTLWKAMPNAALGVVPNASHALHLEKPGIFQGILDDYLSADIMSE